MTKKINLFANLKSDFASGLVVFLVALPLCLGIALASGAPPLSGIIAGIVGGIVVGFLSRSHISVSGPAAGLTAIVLTAITDLGAFNIFLTAGLIAGLLQLILGFIKAGSISNYFPTNVIEGMLAGIGVIIILKQIPHAVGYDSDFEGDETFVEKGGGNALESLMDSLGHLQLGAILITLISLTILISWDKFSFLKKMKLVPGALVAVIVGVVLNEIFTASGSSLAISKEHLVSLPVPQSFDDFKNIIVTPDFAGFMNPKVWVVGATIAIVASIETLLCIEASDRMDTQKRYTDTNVELKAQGIGNMLSSFLGGLPMTSVVVRSSANANAGAKSKMSTIIHGVLLLISVLSIPVLLNKIPLATLAAVLLMVGYKLAKPTVLMHFWHKGKYQFVPFIITLLGVVFLDLLKGVALGIAISVVFILRGNLKRAYRFRKEKFEDGDVIRIDLAQEVSFLNKAAIKTTLAEIPENSKVVINASDTVYIAHDVLDLIHEFATIRAADENIKVKLKGFKKAYELNDIDDKANHVFFENYEEARARKQAKADYDRCMALVEKSKEN
ncbi:SulP family inorganic anion transporter [Flavobacterium lindanitolerans]|jgi:MFS superfamily sulfate permease-like transporter|uniref:MFS superfamily sulfate permease-like transporter n=2 Tax=Flavobacterium TaxID=237 RepID=A0A497UD82_9FLAO|nr:SulP family inorganic anion transporter [Flavobacterium lindanitolerans]MBU7569481.1 SulP family inorganic anion transporter [Flavobacterium sp.]PZQ88042.1 MAG: SulP family inorganic anion transporter [Flavobacterium johnsoniae]MBL7868623.1 SulP family inorganic anion transporter [Flavobacterium lindanitolerans]MDQ7961284.1 SulP family inorganic anion transporter [Flavobacterium lindanitolerans]PKW30184.1 MFS superfamily sulfate permease-like transporter [Flavobacterium lindanitolerans]